MRSIASSIALSAIVAALCTGTLAHADSFERTVPADARGEVEIINRGGDVQVRGWDRAEVQIHADVDEDDDERINVQSGTGRTSINVLRSGREGGSTDMIVQVPRDARLYVDGKGESAPIASNETAAGKAQNRRVEILIRPFRG